MQSQYRITDGAYNITPTNTNVNRSKKLMLINHQMKRIKEMKKVHFKKFQTLKKFDVIFKSIVNMLNTISVTGLVLNFTGTPFSLYVSTTTSTLSAIMTAVLSVASLESKYHSHQTSYLQFIDLYDTTNVELVKDNLTSSRLDTLLEQLNTRINLILDTCEPITYSISSPEQRYEPSVENRLAESSDILTRLV